jgi:arylsulfatase A-like enzyme
MLRDNRWKYIHHNRFRPQLFDLQRDPQELIDLGDDSEHEKIRQQMRQLMIDWHCRLKPRIGAPYDNLAAVGPEYDEARGIVIGRW